VGAPARSSSVVTMRRVRRAFCLNSSRRPTGKTHQMQVKRRCCKIFWLTEISVSA